MNYQLLERDTDFLKEEQLPEQKAPENCSSMLTQLISSYFNINTSDFEHKVHPQDQFEPVEWEDIHLYPL